MSAKPTVDREQEIAEFLRLLNHVREGYSSILFIEESSGRGKSRLLKRFKDICGEQVRTWSYVDLVGGSLTPIDILKRIAADLNGVPLKKLWDALNKRGVIAVSPEISNNRTFGSTSLNIETTIHLERLNQNEQKQLWSDAAHGFNDDLRDYWKSDGVVVLLFDTYEKAVPESQVWITDHILPAVARQRVPGLFIVVAGKSCPKQSGEWGDECEFMPLPPLKEEHWSEYAKLVGASLTAAQIRQLYEKHEGEALKMAETVDLFIKQ